MIDGGGCMERDRRDLLNPHTNTHTFHLSLSLSRSKTSSFLTLSSSGSQSGSWGLLFGPSGSVVESKRLCSGPHARDRELCFWSLSN